MNIVVSAFCCCFSFEPFLSCVVFSRSVLVAYQSDSVSSDSNRWYKVQRQVNLSEDASLFEMPFQHYTNTASVRITWKPEYAGPPHLFSLPHRSHAVVENSGTEGPTLIFL